MDLGATHLVHSKWVGQTIYSWSVFSIWLQVVSKQSRRKGVVLWAFFPKPHLFSALLLQLMQNIMMSYPDSNLFSHCWSWWVIGLISVWGEVRCFGLGWISCLGLINLVCFFSSFLLWEQEKVGFLPRKCGKLIAKERNSIRINYYIQQLTFFGCLHVCCSAVFLLSWLWLNIWRHE